MAATKDLNGTENIKELINEYMSKESKLLINKMLDKYGDKCIKEETPVEKIKLVERDNLKFFNKRINELYSEGYRPVGSVQIRESRTYSTVYYSLLMMKEEIINTLLEE